MCVYLWERVFVIVLLFKGKWNSVENVMEFGFGVQEKETLQKGIEEITFF